MVRLVVAALAACLVLSPLPTTAQDDEYRTTIERALAEFDRENYAESLALFRRAHTMRPSARTLRGLGKASYELRRYVDAVNYFTDALTSTVNPLTDEQRAEVTGLLSEAEAFVGRYHVTTTPDGAAIAVDGNESGHALVLDIGEHTITATLDGYEVGTRRITVAGGEDVALTFALVPTTHETIVETVIEERVVERSRPDPGEPFRITGWVLGAAGIGGLVLGITAVAIYEDRVGAYNASVGPPRNGCPALDGDGRVPTTFMGGDTPRDCLDYEATWRAMDPLRWVGFVVGGVGLLAGVVFLAIGYAMEPHDPAPDAHDHDHGARDVARGVELTLRDRPSLAIGCGPFSELGVACTGRF